MAKRRYRRYRRRRHYCPNIEEINQTITASPGAFSEATSLALNPAQANSLVSQKYTVKNFSIDFVIETEDYDAATLEIEGLCVYIMYVPQGVELEGYTNFNVDHPEYILGG